MIHIHVDGSFSRERGGNSGYGFVVFRGLKLTDAVCGELSANRSNFETLAAVAAIDFVKQKYGDDEISLFTDSYAAAADINRSQRNVCAQKIDIVGQSGYFFINNLRAHSLAVGVVRKRPLTPSYKTFEQRFKGWLVKTKPTKRQKHKKTTIT